MNSFRKLNAGIILAVIAAGVLMMSGCKKDEDPTPPALPPASGFVMNFSDFSSSSDTLKSALSGDSYSNWGYAYTHVAIWNTVLTVTLAVPVASYVEAFNHEPVYDPATDSWIWSYNFNVGFDTYLAKLSGKLDGEFVDWEMKISKSGTYTDFLWYRGRSALDQTSGYWILAENPLNANDLLRITWAKNADETENIKYSNVKTGDPENGSYIWYGTANTTYDRFYEIFRKTQNNHTSIEWSATLHNGHVKDPLHFSDNNWHCWDINLQDTVCP